MKKLLEKIFTEIRGEEVRIKMLYMDLVRIAFFLVLLGFMIVLILLILRVDHIAARPCEMCIEKGYQCFKPEFYIK